MARNKLRGSRRFDPVAQMCREHDRGTVADQIRVETEGHDVASGDVGEGFAVVGVSEEDNGLDKRKYGCGELAHAEVDYLGSLAGRLLVRVVG
jgi:hypothetical protein